MISTIFDVLVTLLLETVQENGASEPDQLEVFNVTFWILLFISAHCVLGLSLWGLRPTLIQNSKLVDVTLSTSGWSGSSAPYSYTISNSNILSTTKVIEIAPTETASNAQIIAFMNASLCGGDISTGKVVIKAFGVKPTTNIPILMVVRGTM